MKRMIYLATAALVALLILAPAALAQGTTGGLPPTGGQTQPLPKTGGTVVGSVALPAAALLLGSGVLAYAVLRRR